MRTPTLLRSLCCLLVIGAASPLRLAAQNGAGEQNTPWSLKCSGFIKNDIWWDTRQVFTTREDLFLFYPANRRLDAAGQDINKAMVYNFSAMTTRALLTFKTPDVLGAKVSGAIEGDFSGVSNGDINGLRLRHAYGKLTWPHLEVMAGQYWHPLFSPEVLPRIASLNTGAPFQPFIRNPLLSLTGQWGPFSLLGAAIMQRDNASDGPGGLSPNYIRNAAAPNVHLQFRFRGKHHTALLGGDYKWIKPYQVYHLGIAEQRLGSFAILAAYKMEYGKFSLKLKSILGQNLTEHLMLGGYGEKALANPLAEPSFTPTNHLYAWGQCAYGDKIQVYLFGAYARNFGTSARTNGILYGRGNDVAWLARVTPGVCATFAKLEVFLETEYTVAAYGQPDLYGRVQNTSNVANLRLLSTVLYYF